MAKELRNPHLGTGSETGKPTISLSKVPLRDDSRNRVWSPKRLDPRV